MLKDQDLISKELFLNKELERLSKFKLKKVLSKRNHSHQPNLTIKKSLKMKMKIKISKKTQKLLNVTKKKNQMI